MSVFEESISQLNENKQLYSLKNVFNPFQIILPISKNETFFCLEKNGRIFFFPTEKIHQKSQKIN